MVAEAAVAWELLAPRARSSGALSDFVGAHAAYLDLTEWRTR